MGRDGNEAKDFSRRQRSTGRRRVGFDQKLMPEKRHPAVYAGMAFAILGGVMIASALLVSWVDSFDPLNSLVRQLFTWDLPGIPDLGVVYFLAIIAPISGIACAALSAIALAGERRRGLRKTAAIGALVTSAEAALFTALLIWMLREQFIIVQLERSIYGPAIFLSVFGCVLAVAGGIVLAADYFQSERKKGAFVTAPGSKHLKTALKPAKRGQPSRGRGFRDRELQSKEIRDEMLAAEETEAAVDEERLSCPNCQSPVKASWKQCPVCGEGLAAE